MSSNIICSFCQVSLELASYVDHVIRDCDSLSNLEKNRAQEAINKLLCDCRVCEYHILINNYEHHRAKQHPHTAEYWHDFEPELACYCPFAPRTTISGDMPFSKYRLHVLKECSGYITFIIAHCRPPKDWPKSEVDRLDYWLRVLESRRQSQSIVEESDGKSSGPSIWITFVQGGLCNGR